MRCRPRPARSSRRGSLSAAGKWRIFGEPFRRGGGPPEESVRDFFARRLGPEIADRIVTPFVGGIFAGDPARLAVAEAFPSLARWEREHGSIVRGAMREARSKRRQSPAPAPAPKVRGLLSFRDGLETLPLAMARALGPAFRPSSGAVEVSPRPGGWRVTTAAAEWDAGEVILAAPALAASELVRPFAPDAAAALAAVPHPPLAVLHLAWPTAALARPFRGFGHLVVPDPSRRVLGGVWSSSLFPGRAPEGQVLMTVFLGGARDPDAFALSDAELVAAAARDLESEGIVRGQPRLVLLTRWPRAIPQYERGHGARIEALVRAESRWPGLRFVGNYRGGISVGDVLASAVRRLVGGSFLRGERLLLLGRELRQVAKEGDDLPYLRLRGASARRPACRSSAGRSGRSRRARRPSAPGPSAASGRARED